MDFDDKAHVVAEAWMLVRKSSEWDDVVKYGDVGFPLAYAYDNDLCSVQEGRGRAYVEEVYELLLNILQVPDIEYADFEAMLDKNIELFKDQEPEEEG